MKICKNKVTDKIRHTYKANPLRVPDSRVQPYETMLVGKKKGFQLFGNLAPLLDCPIQMPIRSSTIADAVFEKTNSIDIGTGLNILDGFLKALRIPSAILGLALKGAKEISFSFLDVKKYYLEMSDLGKILSDDNCKINLNNAALSMLNDNNRLCLITDVYASPKLKVNVEKTSQANFDIDIPVVDQSIADANLGVSYETDGKQSISFSGPQLLSYAFSCVHLQYAEDGTISFSNWINTKAYNPNELRSGNTPEKLLLTEDEENPELISLL